MTKMGLLQDQPQKYTVMLARIEAISALKLNMHQDIYGQFRKILQYGCNERLLEGYSRRFSASRPSSTLARFNWGWIRWAPPSRNSLLC